MARKKRFDDLEVSECELLKRQYEWYRAGPMAGKLFTRAGRTEIPNLSLVEGRLIVNFDGAQQIHYYEQGAGHILAVGAEDDKIDLLAGIFKKRIQGVTSEHRKDYRRIFDTPDVQHRGLQVAGEFYQGVGVEVPIKSFPVGAKGGLSDRLFSVQYNMVALPLFKVAWGADWKDLSVWYDFPTDRTPRRENESGGGLFDSGLARL